MLDALVTQQQRTDELKLAEPPLTNADAQAALTRKAIKSEGHFFGSGVYDLDILNEDTIDARLRVRL